METFEIESVKSGLEVLQSKKIEYQQLVEKHKGVTVEGVTDKEGYEAAKNAWRELQHERISVEKQAKALRAYVKPLQETISQGEKELLSILCPEEDRLYKAWKEVDEEKQRAKEEAERIHREMIAKRKAALIDLGMIFDGVVYRFPGNHHESTYRCISDESIEVLCDEVFDDFLKECKEKAEAIAFEAEMERKKQEQEAARLKAEQEAMEEQKRQMEAQAEALRKQKEAQEAEIARQKAEIERMQREAEEAKKQAEQAAKKAKEEIRTRRLASIGLLFNGDVFVFKNRVYGLSITPEQAFLSTDDTFETIVFDYSEKIEKAKAEQATLEAQEKAEIEEKARKEAQEEADRKEKAYQEAKAAEEAAAKAKEEEEKRRQAEKEAMRPESEKMLSLIEAINEASTVPTGTFKSEKMAGIYAFYRTRLLSLGVEIKEKLAQHE
jgi:hypothetical protein